MKNRQMVSFRSLAAGLLMVMVTSGFVWAQGIMGGRGGMMSGQDMREMMQQMMGDMLPPPMDPASLPDPNSAGARLLQRFCTQCHYLPGPGLHTAAQWPPVVERMNRRMQMMSGHRMMMERIEAPTKQELAAIRGYLQAHAQKPLPARLMSELESEMGKAFRATCSQCHTLPDPGQHTAKEWPAVVERMKGYMSAMGKPVPGDREMQQIIDFLRKNARVKDDGH